MARWFVGTGGYVYRDWRPRFYPRGLAARGWLPYYAATFDAVELNSSFYRLPRAANFRAWAAAVPLTADFVYYNNDGRAAAIRNARRLSELLREGAARCRVA